MSPRDYQLVKTHHKSQVEQARRQLDSDPKNPVLRQKLAKELIPLRALRKHHDLNQYLAK
jgi:hypothetical protein